MNHSMYGDRNKSEIEIPKQDDMQTIHSKIKREYKESHTIDWKKENGVEDLREDKEEL